MTITQVLPPFPMEPLVPGCPGLKKQSSLLSLSASPPPPPPSPKVHQRTVHLLDEDDVEQLESFSMPDSPRVYRWRFVFTTCAILLIDHTFGFYGLTLLPTAKMETIYFLFVLITLAQIGYQAGAHRLWSHRSFKANKGVRWFLSLCHVLVFQKDAFEWARDHRVHHKYPETDADPQNSSRGFFFAHWGWAMVRKQPEVTEKGRQLDLKDLYEDSVLMFHRRYFWSLGLVIHLLLPTLIPVYFWGEDWWTSLMICVLTRHLYTLNATFLVNSWAHMYGDRPYDDRIAPVECSIRHWLFGEGFHNFHHAFPWDYSASELGALDVFNPATAVINLFAWMGWAWDLKKVKPEMVANRRAKTGDTKFYYKTNRSLWEWSSGLFTVFGPFLLIRWGTMALKSIYAY